MKLVKQIFIGSITTILYLLAKQNPVPYRLKAGRHLHEMLLLCFVTMIHATRVASQTQRIATDGNGNCQNPQNR